VVLVTVLEIGTIPVVIVIVAIEVDETMCVLMVD
jgi:hypothetical protein